MSFVWPLDWGEYFDFLGRPMRRKKLALCCVECQSSVGSIFERVKERAYFNRIVTLHPR